ncbi:anaerobic glycerol-3-phosphate dehydrogenase subunit A [Moritella sp. 24]|uniref:anaerobic glycerol-3-phosphate dehydrogenase subunit A n=1 Tax=Moritella sp. 24 TaxID=2746230 RepID=UPI001BABB68D|nr:anaerobic glycerol-3-phosphate dehydrogenase subunit A [Moritella sp. 24]QUM77456.1 anaerobic glycerol-3-phosphate dehydrogenase subunit A [Moritella sp. 24]
MGKVTRFNTDVLIIGGGATGTGIMRDCALRGISCILLDKNDIASGTTGRNHGLLHSGARYAVTDAESAQECIQENKILKRIASHCIEETSGLFITLPEDDLDFQDTFINACARAEIGTERLTPQQAIELEPNVNRSLLGAVKVPDGTLDPFRLCASNVLDAKNHGAKLLTYSMVKSLIRIGERIIGAKCINTRTNESFEVYAQETINAAGIWGKNICQYAELNVQMLPAKGSLLVFEHRINDLVINRCRKPADADILVPGDSISLIGTTSEEIDYKDIDKLTTSEKEVNILIEEGAKLAPILAQTRVLRAYAGVRPLVDVGGGDGRNISRGIVLLDHEQRDGLTGFSSILGGKLMTSRLMAEMTTNLVADKLGNTSGCSTHLQPLPGSVVNKESKPKKTVFTTKAATHRHGENAVATFDQSTKGKSIVCECEMVSVGEIEYAIKQLDVTSLVDLRRRTRLGMGSCQGELCTYRASSLFCDFANCTGYESSKLLMQFFEERWKGIKPVLFGDALREAEFTYWLYEGLFGATDINQLGEKQEDKDYYEV